MRSALLGVTAAILCGCGSSPARPTPSTAVTTTAEPVDGPSITGISPPQAVAGGEDVTLSIQGADFRVPEGASPNWTWALWSVDGTDVSLNTRFLSSSEVTAVVPAHLLRNPVIVQISVVTGDPMGWGDGVRSYPRSNAVNFAVVNSSTAGLAYAATFTASPSCASELPAPARKRTYTATVFPDGNIQWAGPTVTPPTGHATISSGTFTGGEFSFSIDVDRDPQSDAFHGIWDDLGGGMTLHISGKGTGAVHGIEITGKLNGLIALYGPVVPPQPGVLNTARSCQAADHAFRFVRQ